MCTCCTSFAEHVKTIRFGTVPGGTQDKTAALNAKEKRWDRDIAAVNQMKKDKIVPKQVDGAADWLERADDKIEIEHFHKYNDLETVKEVAEELKTPKPIEEVKKINKENAKLLAESL